MSTRKRRSKSLPPLQTRILLYLAKHEPQTINETVKGISSPHYRSSYKSSWTAFNSLEKKGLIKKADVKTYRGQDYPRFWLSRAGVFVALVEGASSQDLLSKTIRAYPDDDALQCCLELAPFTGTEGYKLALSAILSKGRFEESDAIGIMLVQSQKDFTEQQFEQLSKILKKHPKQYEKIRKDIDQLIRLVGLTRELI